MLIVALTVIFLLTTTSNVIAQTISNLDGSLLSEKQFQALVKKATAKNPPKNGKQYVFGFANLQRGTGFFASVEGSIINAASQAGLALSITDNRLDGATAFANAQSFIQRDVDFVIEFQTDANFGPRIMREFNNAKIKVAAIDIPLPGATFFGVNNPRAGYMGGIYLAQAAQKHFGKSAAKKAYLVVGELPQSGPIPAMRTGGQVAGIQAILNLPKKRVIKIDTKNTLQESFAQMSNVLNRIPRDAIILILAINDESTTGMIRAVKQAGREDKMLAVGMGASELDNLEKEERFIASVGTFPERYGNYLIPIGLATLAGESVPPAILVNHVMISPSNICKYYSDRECKSDLVDVNFQFPQSSFKKHLNDLKNDKSLDSVRDIIPKN